MTPNLQVPTLSASQIEELGQFTTPTVANALELSGSWDRISGIVSPASGPYSPTSNLLWDMQLLL